jgi:hypothetical protein
LYCTNTYTNNKTMNTEDSPPMPMPTLFEPTLFEPTLFKKVGFTHPDNYVENDAECLKQLQEYDEVMKGNQYSAEMWVPFDYGFDHENGDKDNRNRLEEAMTQIEKMLAEEIVVPGCQLAECKRAKDGVRIKAYWAEPEYDERGRREENHIMLHLCKYTFKEINVPQIILLCSKRGGDIFPHLNIVKQLKEKIETPSNQR